MTSPDPIRTTGGARALRDGCDFSARWHKQVAEQAQRPGKPWDRNDLIRMIGEEGDRLASLVTVYDRTAVTTEETEGGDSFGD